ncbi:MAG: ATP-binding protein, partial [Bdellovibrionaceae bacterium]|nr:ATP-binding protein [Pseudobdellovibrionaceae bacterium]
AMALHLGVVAKIEIVFQRPNVLFLTFVLDAILISGLIYFSGLNQSLFLFLHLINILVAGIVFRTEGGLIVALLTSLFFTGAALFGPDIKAMQFILLLVLNNIAFFLVAGLSGYLSDQLENVGSELKKTGLSLKAARELNQLVIENIPSGLVTFDSRGDVLQHNEASLRILGIESMDGVNLYDVLKGFEPREVDEPARFDLKYQNPQDGSQRVLGVLASGFDSPELGGPVRVALLEDLTKVRHLEGNLRQAEKMAAVGQLAAGIAHEIRNPLSGISGSVELLSQNATDEDDKKLMKIILREIDRLNLLISEFLDYARPEAPPVDPVDLVPVLQEVLDSVSLSKGVRKETETVRSFPIKAVIAGKSEKLKQAFLNILINSHQAMENTLRPVLEVSIAEEENQTVVRIRDNGSGMKESTLKRIFEPFHTTKTKGTGLGLAITHKILEGHGARIFVESEEGRGTEFKLVFPRFELRS